MAKEKKNNEAQPQVKEESIAENAAENAENAQEAENADAQSAEIEALKLQLDDSKGQLLRMAAEYDNFKKRSQREKDELFTKSKVYVITEFLPVIDNFERAAQNEAQSLDDYKKGIEMIFDQFKAVTEKLGVEAFGAEGDSFDPVYHNAVMHKEDDSLGENVISKVFQKGYKVGDTVLRCAMVETAN